MLICLIHPVYLFNLRHYSIAVSSWLSWLVHNMRCGSPLLKGIDGIFIVSPGEAKQDDQEAVTSHKNANTSWCKYLKEGVENGMVQRHD